MANAPGSVPACLPASVQPGTIRVLLIEDDADDYILTRDLLAEVEGTGFRLDWEASYEGGLEAIARAEHDVYLLDYGLGARTGLELLREAVQTGSRAPLILLTGLGDRDVDVEAMRAGAADFLTKGRIDSAVLERSIRYAIERKQMHEELERRVQERTAELAQANVALQAEVCERQRAEEQIKASLREKEVLLREIHHRVKNNLQVISSLLSLQSRYIHDSQALEMFKESQDRVKAMAVIHEKMYQSRDLVRIHFGEYVRSVAGSLFRNYAGQANGIDLKIDVADVFLGIDTAIPCALIINELLSNSLKHAFPAGRKGAIHIDLRPAASAPAQSGPVPTASAPARSRAVPGAPEKQFILTVRDDGVGFPSGVDFRNSSSLGLQIVTALTKQLDGTIELSNGGGSTFQLVFNELLYRERG